MVYCLVFVKIFYDVTIVAYHEISVSQMYGQRFVIVKVNL